jgi:hypothetical protein
LGPLPANPSQTAVPIASLELLFVFCLLDFFSLTLFSFASFFLFSLLLPPP